MSKYLLKYLLAGTIIMVVNSCDTPVKYPDNANFQKRLFSDSTFQHSVQINPTVINIYVDVSLSVQGFIETSNSDFLNSIRDLCSIVNPDSKINFFTFGTRIRQLNNYDLKGALNYLQGYNNYNDVETRFDLVFNNINKINNNEINLVFTDGIQSENKNTQNTYVELAKEIRKFIKEGNLFGLLGNKGNFSGWYYPEVNVEKFQYEGIRPYYCFIFAPRVQIDFIKTHLIENWKKYLLIFPVSLETSKVDLDSTNIGIDESLVKYNTFCMQNTSNADTFKIPIILKSDDFKFWDLNNLQTTLEVKRVDIYEGCKNDTMEVLDESRELKHITKVLNSSSEESLKLLIRFKPVPYNGTAIYRFTFTPNIPDWINEWSTDYDGNSANVDKTFALKSFTHNLLKITNENQFALFSLYFIL